MSKIKPTKKYIFVQIDKTHADTITSEGGLELMLIMGWGPGDDLWHVAESGTVVAGPSHLNKEFNTTMDVLPGDKIYFHFHVVNEDNRVVYDGEEYYLCTYDQAYCVIRDGKIIMLSDHVLAQPAMEEQEDAFTKSGIQLRSDITPIPIKNRAVISHMPDLSLRGPKGIVIDIGRLDSNFSTDEIMKAYKGLGSIMYKPADAESSTIEMIPVSDTGFSVGDQIHYSKDSDIPIKIEGEIYYRMQINDVWGKIVEGEVQPLSNRMLVIPKEEAEKTEGGIIKGPKTTRRKYAEGKVVRTGPGEDGTPMTVKKDDMVIYTKGYPVSIDGTDYHWVKEDDVMGILEN